jgi:hypothetical protein
MDKEISYFFPEKCPMALFLDADNLTKYESSDYDLGVLLDALKPWGQLLLRRAYGVRLDQKVRLCQKLLSHQFQLTDVGAHKKNCTDICIVMEIMEILYAYPGIKTYVVATGDGDFLEVVRRLHQHQRAVIGVGSEQASSPQLVKLCDKFLFIENLKAVKAPKKNDQIASHTVPVRLGAEAMRTWLRKCNLMPPDPTGRRQVLQQIAGQAAFVESHAITLRALQDRVVALCEPFNISKTAVRHVFQALVKTIAIPMADPTLPPFSRRVTAIPALADMEMAAARTQLQCLLSCPDLVADPIALAEVIWDEPQRAPEMERLIDELCEKKESAAKLTGS